MDRTQLSEQVSKTVSDVLDPDNYQLAQIQPQLQPLDDVLS